MITPEHNTKIQIFLKITKEIIFYSASREKNKDVPEKKKDVERLL